MKRIFALFFLTAAIAKAAPLSPCRQAFLNGYNAYKEGRTIEAKSSFEKCTDDPCLLQKYAEKFLKNIKEGIPYFSYEEQQKPSFKGLEPYLLAKAYFSARKYKEAAEIFKTTADDPRYRLPSLELLATALSRHGKNFEAIEVQKKIAEEFKRNGPAYSKALFKIGFLFIDSGDYQSAKDAFLKLKKIFSAYKRNQTAWYIAWCDYKLGNFKNGAHGFKNLEKEKGWEQRAKFWRATALKRSGEDDDAAEIFDKLSQKQGYYGILAEKSCHSCESRDPVSSKDSGFRRNDYQQLSTARELDALGLKELVAEELEGLKNNFDPDEFYRLAEKNDAWRAIFLKFEPYPRAYPKILPLMAKKHNVDHLFALAVMREESKFFTKAISRSGAIGLMQLMPFTAERVLISKDIAKNYPLKPKRLLEPELNIKAGIKYLSFLSSHYKGNLYHMAAGYNAGEEAVDRWLLSRKKNLDVEFVEEIPYTETQNYVKKVMASYWMYMRERDI